jgi:hypothetical protein
MIATSKSVATFCAVMDIGAAPATEGVAPVPGGRDRLASTGRMRRGLGRYRPSGLSWRPVACCFIVARLEGGPCADMVSVEQLDVGSFRYAGELSPVQGEGFQT